MEDPRIISALFIFLKMAYYNVLINTPRKMMGIESCGMLLSAVNNLKDSEDEELHLVMVDNHIPAGAKLYQN